MWKWKIGRWLFRSGPASDQMIKRLQEAALALEKIPASTEHEFVAFGEDLQRFHAMAGHIAKLSFKIAKQMSDDSMQSGISGLQYIFNRILELDERSRSGAEALGSMLTGLEVMQHQLQAFARIIRNLHVLCRLIRIESARFDLTGQEFQTLADDVNKLTQEIETSLRRFQEQSDAMVAMIRGNYSRIGLFRGGQQENGRVILDHAVGDIKSLEEQNRLASRILTETAERWKQLSGEIGEIVSSLQFHDITRQRIEHSTESLRRLAESVASGTGRRIGKAHGTAGVVILQTCYLQQIQLRNAGTEMEDAGERMIRSIQGISQSILDIARQTRRNIEGGKSAGASFISDLQKSLGRLNDLIADYELTHREILATLKQISEHVSAMSAFTGEIQRLGMEIRKVALNACIHSAHSGQRGLALGVLAVSIHELSAETDSQIGRVSDALERIISAAGTLSAEAPQGEERTASGSEHMSTRVDEIVKLLCDMNADVTSLVKRIDSETDELIQSLNAAVGDIDAHRKMNAAIQSVHQQLAEIVSEVSARLPESERSLDKRALLQDHLSRYTMSRERDIHQSFLKSAGSVHSPLLESPPGEPDGTSGIMPAKETSELGDNVELF